MFKSLAIFLNSGRDKSKYVVFQNFNNVNTELFYTTVNSWIKEIVSICSKMAVILTISDKNGILPYCL